MNMSMLLRMIKCETIYCRISRIDGIKLLSHCSRAKILRLHAIFQGVANLRCIDANNVGVFHVTMNTDLLVSAGPFTHKEPPHTEKVVSLLNVL